jgi:cell division protein FtsQ
MTIDERDLADTDSVLAFTRRPWRHRLRAWRWWLVIVALVAVVALTVWVVFFSSWLGVRTVEVNGAHDVSSRQVTVAADVAIGTPLARVNLDAVEARVEAIPAIASATVSRGWPHSIVVRVTERQPVALVHRDGAWWVMDKTAVLYAKAQTRTPSEPIVELDGHPGPQTLPQVASVLGTLPPSLLTATRRVTAWSMDSITLVLKNGSQVRWGSAAGSAQKSEVLQALLHRKARIYDVTIPSQPATHG